MISELFKIYFNTFPMILLLLIMSGCVTSTPNPNSTPVPRRIFKDLRVYSAIPGTPNQFYDPIADKFLSEDVWVFRSNGTYKAEVSVDGEILELSGVYAGDDTGQGFTFSIETNNDSAFDEELYTDDNFSFIEWRRNGETLKYYLAK
jgi:hypothetical protein